MSEEFGLTLFGFDAILPTDIDHKLNESAGAGNKRTDSTIRCETPVVTVIDVNYFPSYKEVRDFPIRLKAYLNNRKQKASSIHSYSNTDCAAPDSCFDPACNRAPIY